MKHYLNCSYVLKLKECTCKNEKTNFFYRIDPWWLTIFRVGQNQLYSFKERQVKAICWLKFSTYCQALFSLIGPCYTAFCSQYKWKISKVIIRQCYLNQNVYFQIYRNMMASLNNVILSLRGLWTFFIKRLGSEKEPKNMCYLDDPLKQWFIVILTRRTL